MSDVCTPIIVVGGGGAGIVAAWRAAALGARVLLLERNPRIGIKLLISGGGKCNITHAGDVESVRSAFVPREARFLKPALYRFTNADVVRLLEQRGLRTTTRPNGRVFPDGGTARDVVGTLHSLLRDAGVEVACGARVTSITADNGTVRGVALDNRLIAGSPVVVATGGVSYPKTGTTGDGHQWARALGHTIVPLCPALAPIGVRPPLPAAWRGVAVRGGRLSVYTSRKIAEWNGDILFTHEGVSGPAALELSRPAASGGAEGASLHLDILPAHPFEDVDRTLSRMAAEAPSRTIATLLDPWLPNRIVPDLLRGIGIDPSTRCSRLTRDARRSVARMLKDWVIGTVAGINIERGEVTAGGVELAEVDPRTMASRRVRGLYLCGEILDVAGPVGGYNLQAAFSTGFVAGEAAAAAWKAGNSLPAGGVLKNTHPTGAC